MRQVELNNGVKAWAFGSSQYVQAAVKNVEEYLKKHSKKPLPTKGHMNPLDVFQTKTGCSLSFSGMLWNIIL